MFEFHDSNDGFSVVEVLLVLFIIGLIGGASYLVINSQKKNTSLTNTSSESQKDNQDNSIKEEVKADITDNWLKYTSQNSKYSLSIPDGWSLTSQEEQLYAFSSGISYKEGVKATIRTAEGGADGMKFWLVYDYKSPGFDLSNSINKSEKIETYTNKNGVNITKYRYINNQDPTDENPMIGPKGTVDYLYTLSASDKKAVIYYHVFPGDTDETLYIKDSISTFKFL